MLGITTAGGRVSLRNEGTQGEEGGRVASTEREVVRLLFLLRAPIFP